MPAGLLETVPLPEPSFLTVRLLEIVFKVKLAFRNLFSLMVTQHTPVPVQAPLQPEKVDPGEGEAVNLSSIPEA